MSKLKVSNFSNSERMFIPVKKEAIQKYADSLELIEEYGIIQLFLGEYKYRCIQYEEGNKYTRNKENANITEVVEIDEKTFNEAKAETSKCIRKLRKSYTDGQYQIDFDYFSEPKCFVMVKVSAREDKKLSNYLAPKGYIEVTGNSIYNSKNICNGSIITTGNIIEGTDGIGKTTIVSELLKEGIVCQDRCMDVICPNMLFDVSMEVRTANYQKYLAGIDKKIIFLINNDRAELERRIYSRGEEINEFDKLAYEYNVLYLDTFNYMSERNMLEDSLFMVDCTGLSIDEEIEKVKEIIFSRQTESIDIM